jgi:hypothetical protein
VTNYRSRSESIRRWGQKEYDKLAKVNEAAIEKARKDDAVKHGKPRKFMVNAEFWRDNPQYGYRDLPSFDLGHHSVSTKCLAGSSQEPKPRKCLDVRWTIFPTKNF